MSFVKTRPGAPAGFFAVEAAGLRWLAAARGVTVAEPLEVTDERLVLEHVREVAPDRASAEAFGRALAATHRAGATWHGCPPDGWAGDGFIATLPLPHLREPGTTWGEFYAQARIGPYVGSAGLAADPVLGRLCERLCAGDEDVVGPAEPPSRLHGDLWSGNVLWGPDGVVLVDPAAHGGHRETDLAMLALFGLPFLDVVLAAYDEAYPLAEGWRQRVALHQVHPLLVHAALFGGGYAARAVAAARRHV